MCVCVYVCFCIPNSFLQPREKPAPSWPSPQQATPPPLIPSDGGNLTVFACVWLLVSVYSSLYYMFASVNNMHIFALDTLHCIACCVSIKSDVMKRKAEGLEGMLLPERRRSLFPLNSGHQITHKSQLSLCGSSCEVQEYLNEDIGTI